MGKNRELVKRDQWGCSDCVWTLEFPVVTGPRTPPEIAIQEKFMAHDCALFPRKPKPRENVNQAAARIERDATKD